MRGVFFAAWLLVPIMAGAYHYGPGQERLKLDQTADALSAARKNVQKENYAPAIELFSQALAELPSDRIADSRRIRIERAKAQLLVGRLPDAYNELAVLVPEMQEDPEADKKVLADAENAWANAKYYLTWLMRLEGRPRQEWEPEIEGSRQLYRLLAEQARDRKDEKAAVGYQEDLEAAIRLARLDLSELQALPLPSQCRGCKSGDCNCKGKGQCKGTGKTMQKREGKKDARGASSGPPPDKGGN
jgi:hypothetical protein